MRYLLGTLILAVCVDVAPLDAGTAGPLAQAGSQRSGKTERSAAKDSLTGCVDERDGQYMLTNDTDLRPVARLQPAAGSPEDNFAKHVGHKVTVRGKLSKEGPLPLMTVQSIVTVSEACAPARDAH